MSVLGELGDLNADSWVTDRPDQTKIDAYISKHPDFVKAYELLYKNQKLFHMDMHDQNVMQRKDGIPVISDPYSGGGK